MKESLYGIDKKLVFRESFLSEADVRRNGGVPTNVTFGKGVAVYNGTNSKLHYPQFRTPYYEVTVRVRAKLNSYTNLNIFCAFQTFYGVGAGAFYADAATGVIQKTGGTTYINGVAESTFPLNVYADVVVSGLVITCKELSIGTWFNDFYHFDGEITLFEIYSGTLTAEEVKNLYENKIYKPFTLDSTRKLILDVNAFDGTIRNRLSGDTLPITINENQWSLNPGWSLSNGLLVAVGAEQYMAALIGNFLTVGCTYSITYTLLDYVSGSMNIAIGSANGPQRSANGTYTDVLTAADNGNLYVANVNPASFTGKVGNIFIKVFIPTVIPTNVQVVKENDVWAMRFIATTSQIDCGGYDSLIGDKTFVIWTSFKKFDYYTRLINNGKLDIGLNIYANLRSLFVKSAATGVELNSAENSAKSVPTCYIITRTSAGLGTCYINGVISGVSASTDTPVAGTGNIIIGNITTGGNNTFSVIPSIRIIDGLLTPAEISQLYTNEKYLYGL